MKKLSAIISAGTLLALFPLGASAQLTNVTLDQSVNVSVIKGGTNNVFEGNTYNGLLVGHASSQERRSLIRFDLSDYAGQTVVGDATLYLTQANTGSLTGTYSIEVYQIAAANYGWERGTSGSGAAALPGQSAWGFKNKGAAGESDVLWAGSAGLSTAGVDYLADPIGTITYNTDNNGDRISFTVSESLMQFWIDNPLSNAGLLFMRSIDDADSLILGSYTGTGTNRPTLEFTVGVIPEASTTVLLMGAAALGVAFVMKRRRLGR